MGVPAGVDNIHTTHPALNHPPSQKTRAREGWFFGIDTVKLQRLGSFTFQIHQFRRAGLQTKRHLIRLNARGNFRVVFNGQPAAIERADEIERITLQFHVHAVGTADIKDGIA